MLCYISNILRYLHRHIGTYMYPAQLTDRQSTAIFLSYTPTPLPRRVTSFQAITIPQSVILAIPPDVTVPRAPAVSIARRESIALLYLFHELVSKVVSDVSTSTSTCTTTPEIRN